MHKSLGIGKKINKALEKIDSKNSIKIRIHIDTDSSFEYAENQILVKHGINYEKERSLIPLYQNALCKNMTQPIVNLIKNLSIKHKVLKGNPLFHQDDEANSLFILLQGEIEVRLYTSKKEYKRLAKYISGTYFGEISFITPGKRTASAFAIYDSLLLEFSYDDLNKLDEKEKSLLLTSLFFELGSRMSQELRESAQEIRRLEEV